MDSRRSSTAVDAVIDLRESRLLCGLMVALGINAIAWSMPTPSLGALSFTALCFTLALVERRRANARFRRAKLRTPSGPDAQPAPLEEERLSSARRSSSPQDPS